MNVLPTMEDVMHSQIVPTLLEIARAVLALLVMLEQLLVLMLMNVQQIMEAVLKGALIQRVVSRVRLLEHVIMQTATQQFMMLAVLSAMHLFATTPLHTIVWMAISCVLKVTSTAQAHVTPLLLTRASMGSCNKFNLLVQQREIT
jgi:hypothetical protein